MNKNKQPIKVTANISAQPSISLEIPLKQPKYSQKQFYALTILAAVVFVVLLLIIKTLFSQIYRHYYQEKRIADIEKEIEQAWNNAFLNLSDMNLPVIGEQVEFIYDGNIDTKELDDMISKYNEMVESFTYGSDIILRLKELEVKRDEILKYAEDHIFVDDGTLASEDINFNKLIEASKLAIEKEVKEAEEKYYNEINKIIERYNIKTEMDTSDETMISSTRIFIPQANYINAKITENIIQIDYKPLINEISDEYADKALVDEINNKVTNAFTETFSKLNRTEKTASSFTTINDITLKYEEDQYLFDSDVSEMVSKYNTMVESYANRGESFPNSEEMKKISDSFQDIINFAKLGYVRVPNKELDLEIQTQLNLANNESKVSQLEVQKAIEEFDEIKREIFQEYGYTLNNLPISDEEGWQVIFDVEPEISIVNKKVEIPFSRITFRETFERKVMTTTIKSDMADGNVFWVK